MNIEQEKICDDLSFAVEFVMQNDLFNAYRRVLEAAVKILDAIQTSQETQMTLGENFNGTNNAS